MNSRCLLFSMAIAFLCGCAQDIAYPFPEGSGKPNDAGNLKEITNSVGMKLVLIPKGRFLMGSPPDEVGSDDSERRHEVTISRDYYLGVHEVTQAQYKKVMGKNPSHFQGDQVAERHPQTNRVVKDVDSSNHPVESVSWDEAVELCQRLSALPEEKKAGRVYRLPTEAEWEYACRAESETAFHFGGSSKLSDDFAWFGNSNKQTHPVGQKKPNAWGLYDMHGNVFEWCGDWFNEYPKGAVSDPTGPKDGVLRVNRGGSWEFGAASGRSATRFFTAPFGRGDWIGFRVALSSSQIPKSPEAGSK